MLDIFLGCYKNKVISELFILKYKDKVSAEIACSDPNYWNLSPNHFLFWSVIQKAHSEGYKIFDFGRTSPDNFGLMDFKRRWNSKEMNFYYFYNNEKVNIHKKSYQIINFMLKLTPKFILKKFGEVFYKHFY